MASFQISLQTLQLSKQYFKLLVISFSLVANFGGYWGVFFVLQYWAQLFVIQEISVCPAVLLSVCGGQLPSILWKLIVWTVSLIFLFKEASTQCKDSLVSQTPKVVPALSEHIQCQDYRRGFPIGQESGLSDARYWTACAEFADDKTHPRTEGSLERELLTRLPVATGDRLVPSEARIPCSPRAPASEHALHGRAGGDGV